MSDWAASSKELNGLVTVWGLGDSAEEALLDGLRWANEWALDRPEPVPKLRVTRCTERVRIVVEKDCGNPRPLTLSSGTLDFP